MEVVHRRVEEEEQLGPWPQAAEFADPNGYVSSDDTSSDGITKEESPNSVYLDKLNEETKIQWSVSGEKVRGEDAVEISKILNIAVTNRESIIGGLLSASTRAGAAEENVGSMEVVEEEGGGDDEEEDEIELEFERAVDKAHTHTPFCPNCSNQITKVILRRKRRSNPRPEPLNLLGCLSCFSIFIPSGDCLNPFGFFGSKPKIESPNGGTTTIAAGENHSLNPFNCFRYKPKQVSPKIEGLQPSTEVGSGTTSEAEGTVSSFGNGGESSKPVREFEAVGPGKFMVPTHQVELNIKTNTDTIINIVGSGDINLGDGEQLQKSAVDRRSKSFEILKCIVYGGLLQSIASLSVVSSAAASDATTLNVVTIGLATVFGGLMTFANSLLDLKNEVGSNDKYEEALGRKGHFLFHSTFAVFSYLLFGLVAPTTYGFTFHESDDKDYKIIAVAIAGFVCVLLLSIAKAYVKGANTLGSYVKTILYYVTMVAGASGVAYAAGDLIGIFLDKFGWFESPQGLTFDPTPMWASY